MHKTFLITGTGTDVGKTLCAALLVGGTQGRYWKPIQSGTEQSWDRATVQTLCGLPEEHFYPERYAFRAPLSPYQAATLEKTTIDLSTFEIPLPTATPPPSPLFIEGAGGLLVPLTADLLMIDLFARLKAPLILCASTTLGTINHTLLSLEALRARGLPLHGIVFNGPAMEDTMSLICHLGHAKRLGYIPPLSDFSPSTLQDVFHRFFCKDDYL